MSKLENILIDGENNSAAEILNHLLYSVGIADVLLHIKEYCINVHCNFSFETDNAGIKFVDDNIIVLKK